MRKLQTSDLFQALRLIKKVNLKDEIKPMLTMAASGEKDVTDIGIEGILSMIEIFTEKNSETAIYEFLAGPFEMTGKEIGQMDPCSLIEQLEKLAQENDLHHFFMVLQGMITRK